MAAWEAECIRRLMDLHNVTPALFIIDRRPASDEPHRSPAWKRLRTLLRARKRLWVLYERLFVDGRIPALAPVDVANLQHGVPQISCTVMLKGKFSEYFTPADIERIRAYKLDFILRFAFGIIRGEILTVPRYGVWSFHHGDEERYRGGPPAFWEIYFGEAQTGVLLQRLTERLDAGVPLRKRWFPTVTHSLAANRNTGLFGAVDWPAEVCRDIAGGNIAYLEARPSSTSAPIYSSPNDREMLQFALRVLSNSLSNAFEPNRAHHSGN